MKPIPHIMRSAVFGGVALAATAAFAVTAPIVDVFGHNEQDNGDGKINDMIIGSGMNSYGNDGNPGWPAGEGDPSTWTATSNAYQAEWQSKDLLDAGESPTNGKIGWTVFDLGSSQSVNDLYIWHIRENNGRWAATFNVYIATAPTVAVPHGPTSNSSIDYDFSSGGWTKVNGAVALTGSYQGNQVVNIGGSSARYIGIEILSNNGDGSRVGFAEVGVTVSDTTPPAIDSTVPIAGSTGGFPLSGDLVATFDEDIVLTDAGSITITDITGTGTDDRTINLPDAGVTVSGTDLIIDPGSDLLVANEYEVTISGGALQDTAASPNVYGGTTASEWTFTTPPADGTPPVLTGTDPLDNAVGVAPSADLMATFDEGVAAGTGNILINNVTDGGTAATIDVNDGTQVSFSGNVMTISPTTPLPLGKELAVQIASTAVENYVGGAYAGIADNATWSFSTVSDTIYAGETGDWNKDTWNNGSNWSAGVPSGSLDAIIAAGEYASTYNTVTPAYSGDLTLAAGATLEVGQTNQATAQNVFGGGTITMNAGSEITERFTSNSTHSQNLVLAGNATYAIGRSTSAHNKNRTWSGPISGAGLLTVHTTNGQRLYLTGDNSSWTGGLFSGGAEDENGKATIEADATNSLGSGPVTVDDGVTLRIDAADATTGTTSTLTLAGAKASNEGAKLYMNQSDEVGQLTVDGFPYPNGTHGKVGSAATFQWPFIDGSGILTVSSAPADSTDPTLVSSVPAHMDTNVYFAHPITLEFDEPVLAGAGNIVVKKLSDMSTITVSAADTNLVSISGTSVVVDLGVDLELSTVYAVLIDGTAFTDLFGNAYAGISDDSTLNFTTAGPPSGGVEIPADKIQGTPTYAVQGTLLAIDGPQSSHPGDIQTISAPQGPDWPQDADDGWELLGGSIFRENNRSGWEPDGTPYEYRTGTFSSAASGNQARWSFDLPDGAIIHNVWATWYSQGNSGSGHTYSYNEGTLTQHVRAAANSSNHLSLQWLPSDNSPQNINFERIFEGDITVAGGDGFVVTFDAQSGFANIDAVVIDYSLPTGGGDPFDDWVTRDGASGVTFEGDLNGDGVADGLAFLLGADNPNVDAAGLLPASEETGGSLKMTFSCLAAPGRAPAVLDLEWDGDLAGPWTSVVVPDAAGNSNPSAGTGSVAFTIVNGTPNGEGDAILDVEAIITDAAEAAGGKLFGRLKGAETAP